MRSALVHHDRSISLLQRLLHVVSNHQRRQRVFSHDLIRNVDDLVRGARIERGSVLIEKQ
jgi:hypothetical protein